MLDITRTPFPVRRALKKLGEDLRDARRRRRIQMRLAAERADISRSTLNKIEKGEEGVSICAYAKVIFIMGMVNRLADLMDQTKDILGLDLESERLPKRIRFPKKKSL